MMCQQAVVKRYYLKNLQLHQSWKPQSSTIGFFERRQQVEDSMYLMQVVLPHALYVM